MLSYLLQILQGYLEISKRRLLHRDIKPSNIFLNKDHQIKIVDFGFCIKQEEKTKKYQYNVGSLHFLAPQALSENIYSAKTDIWAIGITIYQMVTKKTPWRGKTQKQLMNIYAQAVTPPDIFDNLDCNHIISDFLKRSIVFKEEDRMSLSELENFINGIREIQNIKLSRHNSQKIKSEEDYRNQIHPQIFTAYD